MDRSKFYTIQLNLFVQSFLFLTMKLSAPFQTKQIINLKLWPQHTSPNCLWNSHYILRFHCQNSVRRSHIMLVVFFTLGAGSNCNTSCNVRMYIVVLSVCVCYICTFYIYYSSSFTRLKYRTHKDRTIYWNGIYLLTIIIFWLPYNYSATFTQGLK